jgi:hypothetical protein
VIEAVYASLSNAPIPIGVLQVGGYGPWGTVIDILRGLLIAAGGLGLVLGMAVKGAAAGSADRQELGNHLMEGAIVGLFVGLLGEAIYNLIVGWTS